MVEKTAFLGPSAFSVMKHQWSGGAAGAAKALAFGPALLASSIGPHQRTLSVTPALGFHRGLAMPVPTTHSLTTIRSGQGEAKGLREEAIQKIRKQKTFPGGPVFKTLSFHCRGCRFDPCMGTKIPHGQKIKKERKKSQEAEVIAFRGGLDPC